MTGTFGSMPNTEAARSAVPAFFPLASLISIVVMIYKLLIGYFNYAMRTRTTPFLPPGMAPFTRIRFCSSSMRTTSRFRTVTVSTPM